MLGSDDLAGAACVAAWLETAFWVEPWLAAEGAAALVKVLAASRAAPVARPLAGPPAYSGVPAAEAFPAARRLRASSPAPPAAAEPLRSDNFIPFISRFSSSKLDCSSRRRISATSAAVRLTVDLRRST